MAYGKEFAKIYDCDTFKKPNVRSGRILYVCQKGANNTFIKRASRENILKGGKR